MAWRVFASLLVLMMAEAVKGQSCSSNSLTSTNAKFVSTLPCKSVGFDNMLLWASRNSSTNIVSIAFSAPLTASKWAGVGFSNDGSMVSSTAVIATVNSSGTLVANSYYLGGTQSSQVVVDNSRLVFQTKPSTYLGNNIAYVAFQIDFNKSTQASDNYLLYAYGNLDSSGALQYHTDKRSAISDFTTGTIPANKASTTGNLAKAHAAVNIFGWGILLPIGAIIARYGRNWDPAWFYTHVAFQIIGFIFIIGGLGTGVRLANKIPGLSGLDSHRALGIFIFVLACLQIMAVVLRPKVGAKIRRFWNWYHGWVGRVALLLAAINVFVGIHIAHAEHSLRVGYGVIVAIEIVAVIALETFMCIRGYRQKSAQAPSFQQQSQRQQPTFTFGDNV